MASRNLKRLNKPKYCPIYINLTGKKCVVIGGGCVAARKIKMLLEFDARVIAITPNIGHELQNLSGNKNLRIIHRKYQPGDLEGAHLVISASGNTHVNTEVMREIKERSGLLNIVDNPLESSFIFPAYVKKDNLTIAISTGGRSPALARKIKSIMQKEFDGEEAPMLDLISEIRQELKSSNVIFSGEAWQQALNINMLKDLLKTGKKETARAFLLENLKHSASPG